MSAGDLPYVNVEQLQVGLYVYLDLKWFEHPFAFNNFRIKDEEQIATIRGLGLRKVRFDPARSDNKPSPRGVEKPNDATTPDVPVLKEHPALAAKRALIEKIKVQPRGRPRVSNMPSSTRRKPSATLRRTCLPIRKRPLPKPTSLSVRSPIRSFRRRNWRFTSWATRLAARNCISTR